MIDVVWLGSAAFAAGLVDAVVGGGGLIQIPAMFSLLPREAPATILGTNKLAAIFGTGAAAASYARRVRVAWSTAAPAAIAQTTSSSPTEVIVRGAVRPKPTPDIPPPLYRLEQLYMPGVEDILHACDTALDYA